MQKRCFDMPLPFRITAALSPAQALARKSDSKTPSWTNGLKGRYSPPQVFRFCVVGGFTAAIDFIVLYILVEFVRMNSLVAAGLSFCLAVLLNYILSFLWVFEGGKFQVPMELSLFFGVSFVGLIINQVIMWGIVEIVKAHYMLGKVISLFIVTVWNYLGKKHLVFRE
jgi:putative flippase GtrA